MKQEQQTVSADGHTAMPSSPSLIRQHATITSPIAARTEPELRAVVITRLQAHGIAVDTAVRCAAGTPDIVIADGSVIYEVKHQLTRKALFMAVGQVLLYRQALNPDARAVIVGHTTSETPALVPLIEALGVEVIGIRDWGVGNEERELGDGGEPGRSNARPMASAEGVPAHSLDRRRLDFPGETQAPSLAPPVSPSVLIRHPASLQWNVAALAQLQGIPNASALGLHVGIHRQGLYGIWKGTARQVSLDILERLVVGLQADPGEWFAWEGNQQNQLITPRLRWNVAAVAEARGLDVNHLCFRAQLYMSSLGPIWRGTAQAVSPATLRSIAGACDQIGPPFDVGTLFGWEDVTLADAMHQDAK
jgi:DNA-binding Xre family transcriptional regulator